MMRTIFIVIAMAFALSACTNVVAVSPPPPGKTGALDAANDVITLSRGIALAFQCTGCTVGESFSDDENVARILPAAIDAAGDDVNNQSRRVDPIFVVSGDAVGTTHVRVAVIKGEDVDLEVNVIED